MPDPDNRLTDPRGLECRICRADITFLPPIARYCHRCGAPISPPTSARRFPPRWLANLWCACTDTHAGTGTGDEFFAGRSAVLLAYAKSMFNLGWRYEHAVGARRNLAEAARCYWKAARLGDPSAVGRLGRQVARDPADARMSPPDPDCLT